MKLSTLKRDFLAAFPVIGPHAGIEAELLLAGKKPMGGPFPSFSTEDLPKGTDLLILKWALDRIKLDKAVEEGKLMFMDAPLEEQIGTQVRFYCQPNQYETMIKTWNEHKYIYGQEFGYRDRDIRFFNWYLHLPNTVCQFIREINAPCQQALRNQLLEEASIKTPEEYMRNIFRQLKKMDQEKPDPSGPEHNAL